MLRGSPRAQLTSVSMSRCTRWRNLGLASASSFCLLVSTAPAHANDGGANEPAVDVERPPSGVEFAFRAGLAVPFGKVDAEPGDTLAQTALTLFPIWLDLGWRFSSWFAGLYVSYAPGANGNALDAVCNPCLPQDVRVGLEVQHHFAAFERAWDPWLGVGAGFEWLLVTSIGGSGLAGLQGVELANLQLGVDYRRADRPTMGPFVGLAVGEYLSAFPSLSGSSLGPIGAHAWLILGFKTTWEPHPSRSRPAPPGD